MAADLPVREPVYRAPPAVVNGVLDALRPLGVRDITMPCTPLKVWTAIREAAGAPRAAEDEGSRP